MYGEIPLAKKYAIYARRSTDESDNKQPRSTKDQVIECQQLAERLGLNVLEKPIIESQTAKIPNCRPLFTKLLKRIEADEIDGIISWHPDRLARNMKEGGEIIHLIDIGKIVDLKFVTHPFSNDPSGKMMLGIAFALSKEYSDRLSVNVTRGNKRNLLEGKSGGHYKHGYRRDEQGLYRPHAKNFEFIQQAWQMRLRGQSYEKIVAWLNQHGYKRTLKKERAKMVRHQPMTASKLSNIFADSFYYGILMQGGQRIDLREIYDFVPMISEEEYFHVQRINLRGRKRIKENVRHEFPLRGLIFCGACENTCHAGASRSRTGQRYLYYRCNTKNCTNYGKGIRAKVVFAAIEDQFKESLTLTPKQYEKYIDTFTKRQNDRRTHRKVEIDRLHGTLKHLQSENKRLSDEYLQSVGSMTESMKERRLSEIKKLEQDENALKEQLEKVKKQEHAETFSYDDLLNLMKNADKYWRNADHIKKSRIAELLILNIKTDFKNVVQIRLKPAFESLKSGLNFQFGGPAWI